MILTKTALFKRFQNNSYTFKEVNTKKQRWKCLKTLQFKQETNNLNVCFLLNLCTDCGVYLFDKLLILQIFFLIYIKRWRLYTCITFRYLHTVEEIHENNSNFKCFDCKNFCCDISEHSWSRRCSTETVFSIQGKETGKESICLMFVFVW